MILGLLFRKKPIRRFENALASMPLLVQTLGLAVAIGIAGVTVGGTAIAQDAPSTADLLTASQRADAIKQWENEIVKLETLDSNESDPDTAVLLIGSSSIRLWDDAADDLAPYPIVRRGYGGAKYSDLYVYAPRLIQPHRFDAMVMFVANDVTGGKNDHSIDDVEKWVRAIIRVAREHQPDSAILLVEVTPTPSRFEVWPTTRRLNAMLCELALTEDQVSFVATAESFLDRHGQPMAELFRDDQLHLNRDGYQIWASLIRGRLDQLLR